MKRTNIEKISCFNRLLRSVVLVYVVLFLYETVLAKNELAKIYSDNEYTIIAKEGQKGIIISSESFNIEDSNSLCLNDQKRSMSEKITNPDKLKSTLKAIRSSSNSNEIIVPINITEYLLANKPIQRSELTDLLFVPGNDKLMNAVPTNYDSLLINMCLPYFEDASLKVKSKRSASKLVNDTLTILPEIIIDGNMGRIGVIGDSVIFQTTKIVKFRLSEDEYKEALSLLNKINYIYIRTYLSTSNEEQEVEHPVALGDQVYFVANGKVLFDYYDPLVMGSIKLNDKDCATAQFIRYIYNLCKSR